MPAPENAHVGWEIYKANDYELTLGEINDELTDRGLATVSPRMFSHYRKLQRYGYEQYIPINQLDVRTMADPVWDRALRGRYPRYTVEEPVRVLFLRNQETVQLAGTAEEISDGELVMRLEGGPAVVAFERAKGTMWALEVIFTRTGEMTLCEVAKVTLDRRRMRVTIRASFAGLGAAEDVLARQSFQVREFTVIVGSEAGSPLLGRAAQQVFWLYSAGEGVRIAAEEILRNLDAAREFVIPPNRVERLSVASPLEAVIIAAGPVLVGIGALVLKTVEARKSWWEGTKAKHEARVAEEEVIRLRWERERREVMRSLDLADVTVRIVNAIRDELREGDAAPESGGEAGVAALETHALPAIAELVEAAEGAVTFERREADSPPGPIATEG
jgi:hypothetical protein